jgi:hypothetical protein
VEECQVGPVDAELELMPLPSGTSNCPTLIPPNMTNHQIPEVILPPKPKHGCQTIAKPHHKRQSIII